MELTFSNLPVEIKEKMLYYQVKQGNKRNPAIFEKRLAMDKPGKGFNWEETEEDKEFWRDILVLGNISTYFKKYPKKEKLVDNKDLFNVVVHCKTRAESIKACSIMHDLGLKWADGTSYQYDSCWNFLKENTGYCCYTSTFGNINYYKENNYKVIDLLEFLNLFNSNNLIVGNIVEIIDAGYTYSSYRKAFEILDFKNKKENFLEYSLSTKKPLTPFYGKIFGFYYEDLEYILYGIRDIKTNKEILIEERGIKKINIK